MQVRLHKKKQSYYLTRVVNVANRGYQPWMKRKNDFTKPVLPLPTPWKPITSSTTDEFPFGRDGENVLKVKMKLKLIFVLILTCLTFGSVKGHLCCYGSAYVNTDKTGSYVSL